MLRTDPIFVCYQDVNQNFLLLHSIYFLIVNFIAKILLDLDQLTVNTSKICSALTMDHTEYISR